MVRGPWESAGATFHGLMTALHSPRKEGHRALPSPRDSPGLLHWTCILLLQAAPRSGTVHTAKCKPALGYCTA